MAADASPAGPATPSPSLLSNLREALQRVPPFAQMDAADVDFFLTRSQQRYYAPGEALVAPADGPVTEIFFIRQGAVTGVRGLAELSERVLTRNTDTAPRSGRQEYLENLVNRYL